MSSRGEECRWGRGESGGVQALRAWAGEAIERAKALLPTPGTVAKASRAHDDSVNELDALTRLLDHDPGLRSSVTLWLGGALTLRHGVGAGRPRTGSGRTVCCGAYGTRRRVSGPRHPPRTGGGPRCSC
ncbi:hypothetical protein SAZ11_00275 [Streptomyces sp. FXJ1.4098]|nr:hypothetical protein [Streptomyces sp. FXJ1.4098]